MPLLEDVQGGFKGFSHLLQHQLLAEVQDDLVPAAPVRDEELVDLFFEQREVGPLQGRDLELWEPSRLLPDPLAPDLGGEVRLVPEQYGPLAPVLSDQGQVVLVFQAGCVQEQQDAVRPGGQLISPADALFFDGLGGVVQAGRVYQGEHCILYLYLLPDVIPCGSGEGSDDGPVLVEEPVEQSGFAGVRPSRDRQYGSLTKRLSQIIALDQAGDRIQ